MLHCFLDFELDEERLELRRAGAVVTLQARPFELIRHLLRERARIVSKSELIEHVWEGAQVSETAISQVVSLARKALSDDGQTLIRTHRGHGLRFTAEVTSTAHSRTASPAQQPRSKPSPSSARERELTELLALLEEAQTGKGALVLLEGEPGIGKSWLVEALSERTRARGGVVWAGAAMPVAASAPYWPWVEVLRQLAEPEGTHGLREELGASLDPLLNLVPEHSPATLARLADSDLTYLRVRLFDGMLRVLRHRCRGDRTQPTTHLPRVLVLEDVHAFDDESLRMLRFVSQALPRLGLLVVATYRPLEARVHPIWAELWSEPADGSVLMTLGGLSEPALRALFEDKCGAAVDAATLAQVQQLSSGSPLVVIELAQRAKRSATGQRSSSIDLSEQALPERLVAPVRRHLALLPEDSQRVLCMAAVIGREFRLSELSNLLMRAETLVLEALEPALRSGLVQSARGGLCTFTFVNPGLPTALYQRLSPMERIAAHRKMGELLESAGAEQHALELARHFLLAAASGTREKALRYTELAAKSQIEAQRFKEAALLYDRAVELATAEQTAALHSYELLMGAGEAWYAAADPAQASARVERAARLMNQQRDARRAAWAIAMSLFLTRGSLLFDGARREGLRELIPSFETADPTARALVLCLRALTSPDDAASERDALTARAVELADSGDDVRAACWVLSARQFVLVGTCPARELLPMADELVKRAAAIGWNELLLDSLIWRSMHRLSLGDAATAFRDIVEFRLLSGLRCSPYHRYVAACLDASEYAIAGSFAQASQRSHLAARLGESLDVAASLAHGIRTLFLHTHYGFGEGESSSWGLEAIPSEYRLCWALAWALSDRRDDARRVFTLYLAAGLEQVMPASLKLPNWALAAEVGTLLNVAIPARELYTRLRPAAGEQLMILGAGVYLGPVDYYLALLAAQLGDAAAAEQHFEAALDQTLHVGALPFLVRVREAFASFLLSRAPRRAHGLLREANDLARGVGMRSRPTSVGVPTSN